MTPSAARGVLEAIFWKPEFKWHVEQIHVLRPIRYFSILRNEINSRQTERTARGRADRGGGFLAEDDRAQRHTLALRDVAYRITAGIELLPRAADDVAKYRDQFRRRVAGGRCFATPYLGCREFAASFGNTTNEHPVPITDDLGAMLLDIEYEPGGSGRGRPRFFDARLVAGVLDVPPWGGA